MVGGAVRFPGPALEVEREPGKEAEVERGPLHQPHAGSLEERAVVERLDLGERLLALLDQVCDAKEVAGAALRPEGGPGGERLTRGLNRRVGLFLAPAGDVGEPALVDRRDVRESLGGCDPLAADEVVGRDLDARDGRDDAHAAPSSGRKAPTPPPRVGREPPAALGQPTEDSPTNVWRVGPVLCRSRSNVLTLSLRGQRGPRAVRSASLRA